MEHVRICIRLYTNEVANSVMLQLRYSYT